MLVIDNKSLIKELNSDPLYQMMLSSCISKKRIIYKIKNKINYRVLDLHLLKSNLLLDNFDVLSGREKYYLIRNLLSIRLFMENKKLSNEIINKEIKTEFNLSVNKIKENMINRDFLPKYKKIYNNILDKIMEGIKNGSKIMRC